MSDQPTPAPTPTPSPSPSPAPTPSPGPNQPTQPQPAAEIRDGVPVENQIGEWRRKAEKAEQEAAELRTWKEEQEAAKLTEIERATKERDEALATAQAATERATTMERSSWVEAAARKAGFTDPSDAAAFVKLADLGDEAAAAKAVEDLGKAKPHLLSQARPQGFGSLDGRRTDQAPPLDADGKPDLKRGLGQELVNGLLGGGRS